MIDKKNQIRSRTLPIFIVRNHKNELVIFAACLALIRMGWPIGLKMAQSGESKSQRALAVADFLYERFKAGHASLVGHKMRFRMRDAALTPVWTRDWGSGTFF